MADQDPAQSILGPLSVDNALKAQAWEHFRAAKDPADLANRIGSLALPQEAKAALWEAKKGSTAAPSAAAPSAVPPPPEAGTGLMDTAKSALDWAMTPLSTKPAELGRQAETAITTPRAGESRAAAMAKGAVGGAIGGAGELLSSMTSPLQAALMAADAGWLGRISKPTIVAAHAAMGTEGIRQLLAGQISSGLFNTIMGVGGGLAHLTAPPVAAPSALTTAKEVPPPPTAETFPQAKSAVTAEPRAPLAAPGEFAVSPRTTTARPSTLEGQVPAAMRKGKPQFALSGTATGTGFVPIELPPPPTEIPSAAPLPAELQAAVDAGELTPEGAAQLAAKVAPAAAAVAPTPAQAGPAAPQFGVTMNVPETPRVPPPPGMEGLGGAPGHGPELADWESSALEDLRQGKANGTVTDDALMAELQHSMNEGGPQSAYTQGLIKLLGGVEGMDIVPSGPGQLVGGKYTPKAKVRSPLGAADTEKAGLLAKKAFAQAALARLKPTKTELTMARIGDRAKLPAEAAPAPAAPTGPVIEATPGPATQPPTLTPTTKAKRAAKTTGVQTGQDVQAAEPAAAPQLAAPPAETPTTVPPTKRVPKAPATAKGAAIASAFGVEGAPPATPTADFRPSPTGEAGRVVTKVAMMKEAAKQKVIDLNTRFPNMEAKMIADPEGKGWLVEGNAAAIAKAKGVALPVQTTTTAPPQTRTVQPTPAGKGFLTKAEVGAPRKVVKAAPAAVASTGLMKPSEIPKNIKAQATPTLQSLFKGLSEKASRTADEETTLRAVKTELAIRPKAPPPPRQQLEKPTYVAARVTAEDAANRGFVELAKGPKPEMRDVIAKVQREHGDDAFRVEGWGKNGYRITVDPSVLGTQPQTSKGITVEPTVPEVPPLTSKVGEAAPEVAKAATEAMVPPPPTKSIKQVIDNPGAASDEELRGVLQSMGAREPKAPGDKYVWNLVNKELNRRANVPKGGGPVEPPPFAGPVNEGALKAQLDQLRSSLQKAPSPEQAAIRSRIKALVAKLGGEKGSIQIGAMLPKGAEDVIERFRKTSKPVAEEAERAGQFKGQRETAVSDSRWQELLKKFGGRLGEEKGFVSQSINPAEALRRAFLSKFEPAQLAKETVGEAPVADVLTRLHDPDVAATVFNHQRSKVLDQSFSDAEAMFDRMPKRQQELFNRTYGEAHTVEGKRLQAEALADPDYQKLDPALRKVVKETTDYVHGVAKQAGFDLGYQPDYFYGAYKNREDVSRFIDHWRTTDKFTKEKQFPTRADAEAWGLELRDTNPITNAKRELQAVSRRAAMKGFLNSIEQEKPSWAAKVDAMTPAQRKTWSKIQDPMLNDYRFDPDLARMVNSLTEINKVTTGQVSGALREAARVGQQVKMFGSLFHLRNIMKGAVAAEPMGPTSPKAWRDMIGAFSKPIDETDPAYLDYVNHGGGHHYSIESDAAHNGLMRAFNNVYDRVKDTPVGTLMGKGNPLSPQFVKWMFDTYIPAIKYQGYLKETARQVAAKGAPLTNAEKISVVRRLDEMHGEMNERLFGRSGTVTSGMRLLFMAPGYGEGNFRITARMLKGDRKAIGFIGKSLAVTAATAAIGTRAMTGHWPATPKTLQDARDMFKVQTDQRDPSGNPMMFDMMTYEKDPMSIVGNLASGEPERIPSDLMKRFTGMISPSWRMMTHMATLFNGEVVTDQLGRPVYRATEPWGNRFLKLLQHEGSEGMLPIGASTLTAAEKEGYSPAKALALGIAGVQPTTSEAAKREKEQRMQRYDLREQQLEERRKARQAKRQLLPPPTTTPQANPFGATR